MGQYTQDMAPAERTLIVYPLQESSDEFFLGLPVGLFALFGLHDVTEDVEHDISNGVTQVVGLMSEEHDEAGKIGMEDLGNLLTQFR